MNSKFKVQYCQFCIWWQDFEASHPLAPFDYKGFNQDVLDFYYRIFNKISARSRSCIDLVSI